MGEPGLQGFVQDGAEEVVGVHDAAGAGHEVDGGAADPLAGRQGGQRLLRPGEHRDCAGADDASRFGLGQE